MEIRNLKIAMLKGSGFMISKLRVSLSVFHFPVSSFSFLLSPMA
jgi:hypothetical protein